MNNPKNCEYCKKPLPIISDPLDKEYEYGECGCPSSHYANQSDADRAADAEYIEYMQQKYDEASAPNEADYWDGDETDKIQY
jgi:hypothetical protein